MVTEKLHPLRRTRLEKGLSQYALSLLSGVPQVRISYQERGYSAMNPRQREATARTLDVKVEEIFPEMK